MDFSSICRTCLGTKSLNPIFRDQGNHSRYSLAVYLIAGIKVHLNDGLPQNMCTSCIHFLNEAFKFRKSCKTTETELLEMKAQHNTRINSDKKSDNHREVDVETQKCPKPTDFIYSVHDIEPVIACKDARDDCDIEDDKPLAYFIASNNDDVKIEGYSPDIESTLDVSNDENSTNSKTDSNANEQVVNEEISFKTVTTKLDIETHDKQKLETEIPYEIVTANRVTCKLCQKDLSIRSIDSHMARRHPGADHRKVKCELCDAYVLKGKLKRHMGMVHKSGCSRCGFCKAEFECKDNLVDHIKSCTSKTKKRKVNESGRELKECDVCHKTMQKASLKMHNAVKHAGLGPVCEHCGRRFGNKFRLNEHYRAKHGYEKFKCSYCEFQSAGVMAMRNHERRHRGEKPFVCETCGAKFHAAYLLAQHKQSHRTERLVKCDLCPASFKANNSLHMHKSTCHSGSAYQCVVCGRAYSCRHYVVKHMRHVHSYRGPAPPAMRRLTDNEYINETEG